MDDAPLGVITVMNAAGEVNACAILDCVSALLDLPERPVTSSPPSYSPKCELIGLFTYGDHMKTHPIYLHVEGHSTRLIDSYQSREEIC